MNCCPYCRTKASIWRLLFICNISSYNCPTCGKKSTFPSTWMTGVAFVGIVVITISKHYFSTLGVIVGLLALLVLSVLAECFLIKLKPIEKVELKK
jgi:hypothetical protein